MDKSWMIPQLCNSAKLEEIPRYSTESWSTEGKFNGLRLVVWHRADDEIELRVGRHSAPRQPGKLPMLEPIFRELIPVDTCIDGEIVHDAGAWNEAASAMSLVTPYMRNDLQLMVFDVLRVKGRDVRALPWYLRRQEVEQLDDEGMGDTDRINISPIFPNGRATFDAVTANGLEGMVVKHRKSQYVPGKHSTWVKFKPEQTMVVKLVDFTPGKGACLGMVGSLLVELENGVQCHVGTGMNYDERREMQQNWTADWKGRMVEVKYNDKQRSGKLIGAVYMRRRPDREPPPRENLFSA